MAKLIGQLAGASVQTLKSGTAAAFAPPLYKESADILLVRDMVVLPVTAINDLVSLATLRSTAFLNPCFSTVWSDVSVAGNFLVGDLTFPQGLTSQGFLAAGGRHQMIRNALPAQIAAPLWQRLGYAADPGGTIELLMKLTGAQVAGKRLSWEIWGRGG